MAEEPIRLEPVDKDNGMRDAQNQASDAAKTAKNTSAGFGSQASTIGSRLVPFLSRQMTNPAGMSQQDIGAQLAAGLASSGGATAGLAGAASHRASTARNPMGFSAALDAAARDRGKADSSTALGIAARNANLKAEQQEQAARGLGQLYGMNMTGENEAARNQIGDINSEVNAGKSGWLQNGMGILEALKGKYGKGGGFSFGGMQ